MGEVHTSKSVYRMEGLTFVATESEPRVAPLRYPGFPVEVGGVGKLHAAFFTESRIRPLVSAA